MLILFLLFANSDKFFNVYFYKQMFFKIFVAKGDTGQFFWEVIA